MVSDDLEFEEHDHQYHLMLQVEVSGLTSGLTSGLYG